MTTQHKSEFLKDFEAFRQRETARMRQIALVDGPVYCPHCFGTDVHRANCPVAIEVYKRLKTA